MAFFSDALVHCAYAGVALGLLMAFLEHAPKDGPFYVIGIPLIMVGFGALVGLGTAFVREKTTLATDTVIGVFFAGAIGFAAMLLVPLNKREYVNLEALLFGDLLSVRPIDLLVLVVLGALMIVFIAPLFNSLVFASFNASLARSRRVPLRLSNYLFIVLLAITINLCLKIVGAMLINALLIVPAATAANLCRNMRQLFWVTIGACLSVGLLGLWASWEATIQLDFDIGPSGTIVMLSVVLFLLSMIAGPALRGRQA
jgi:zinc transport system permease protein